MTLDDALNADATHEETASAVSFNRSRAYSASAERLISLGLTEAEARELLKSP